MPANVSSLFAWSYDGPFHSVFYTVTTITALLTNSVLIGVLRISPNTGLGPYKYLPACFALSNAAVSLCHFLLKPIVHISSVGVWMVPFHVDQWGDNAEWLGNIGGTIYACFFYESFLIIAYHFFYRSFAIKPVIPFTRQWRRRDWVWAAVAFNAFYAGYVAVFGYVLCTTNELSRTLVTNEMIDLYGIDLRDPKLGHFAVMYKIVDPASREFISWNWRVLGPIMGFFLILLLTLIVVALCIIHVIMVTRMIHLHSRAHHYQRHLFKALLLQSAVPLLLSYLPTFCLYILPVINVDGGDVGNAIFMLTAIFPAIDPVVVVVRIDRLRAALCSVFPSGEPRYSDKGISSS